MKIIKFIPQTPYATPLRSDTLFGLICWGAHWIYGATFLKQWLDAFEKGSPPFCISSAFPFRQQNNQSVYFLPKPILPTPHMENLSNKKLKDLRRLPYLTLADFQAVINGQTTLWEILSQTEAYRVTEEVNDLLTYNTIDRLTWNTLGKKGHVYQEQIYYFPPEKDASHGLYAYLQASDEVVSQLAAIWRYWEDVGVGRNASIGIGKFKISIADAPAITLPSTAPQLITLSLYHPTIAELQAFIQQRPRFWYQIHIRKGRVGGVVYKSANPFKPKLPFIAEGSLFPALNQTYYGDVAQITQREHPIYYYGYAFTLPVKIKEIQA